MVVGSLFGGALKNLFRDNKSVTVAPGSDPGQRCEKRMECLVRRNENLVREMEGLIRENDRLRRQIKTVCNTLEHRTLFCFISSTVKLYPQARWRTESHHGHQERN